MKSVATSKCDFEVIKTFNKFKLLDKSNRIIQDFRISNDIYFNDKIWNFTHLNINNRSNDKYKFDFSRIPEQFVFYVKMTILQEMLINKNSAGNIKKTYDVVRTLTKKLNLEGVNDVRLIDLESVQSIFEEKINNSKPSYIETLSIKFKQFINIIIEIEGYNLEDIIEYLNKVAKNAYNLRKFKATNDYIPFKFLDQIVSFALKDIDNKELSKDKRIMACLIVIIAETGMRVEEVTLLETNKLDVKKVNGKEIAYLNFYTFKIGGKKNTYTWLTNNALKAYTVCENLVNEVIDNLSEQTKLRLLVTLSKKEALKTRYSYKRLRELVEENDKKTLENLMKESKRYLFISEITGLQKKGTAPFREHLQRFFIRHNEEFDISAILEYEKSKIKKFKINSKARYQKFFSTEERKKMSFECIKQKEFLYVNPHMFRVTVCTKLFLKHVHIDYIVKHLNHLSEEMTVYYNKSDEFINKLSEGVKILSSISNDEGLIETNSNNINDLMLKNQLKNKHFKESVEKINAFLKKNKLNIKKDINDVIIILKKTITPIIENDFGICVRSVIHGICEKRRYFSSASDYYFIGPQLETYKFINFAYERFIQKVQIVMHNKVIAEKDKRFLQEYQREERALKMFVNKSLKKQIELLENDIDVNGIESILKDYPNIKDIIKNLNKIREEISPWMS